MSQRKLIIRGPTFYAPGDEVAFFGWLNSIQCVESVRGHLRELHVTLKRPASIGDLREFHALLRRYKLPSRRLAGLKTARNSKWFSVTRSD